MQDPLPAKKCQTQSPTKFHNFAPKYKTEGNDSVAAPLQFTFISFRYSYRYLCRFDEGAIRILESVLVTKDVKSLLQVRSEVTEFMRHESLLVIREIPHKSLHYKLSVIDFLVRVFALAGDVEVYVHIIYLSLILIATNHVIYHISFRLAISICVCI